jgi:hypothetical protein
MSSNYIFAVDLISADVRRVLWFPLCSNMPSVGIVARFAGRNANTLLPTAATERTVSASRGVLVGSQLTKWTFVFLFLMLQMRSLSVFTAALGGACERPTD